jgi:hypothetical protein
MRRLTLCGACVLLPMAAGCDRPSGPVAPGGSMIERIVDPDAQPTPIGRAGRPYPDSLRFRVLDPRGEPVAGVTVTFEVDRGGGTVSPRQAVTGASGSVAVQFALGPEPGATNVMTASAPGVKEPSGFSVTSDDVISLDVEPDSLVLGPSACAGVFEAELATPGGYATVRTVEFSAADTAIVDLRHPEITGTLRGQTIVVSGAAAGMTAVIARYHELDDTVEVRVLPNRLLALNFSDEPLVRVITGDSLRVPATVDRGCSGYGPVPITFRSLDPEIATISPSETMEQALEPVVTGLRGGKARLVAEAGPFADTVTAWVRTFRMSPGDTTVTAGDTIRFEVLARDDAGAMVPYAGAEYHSDPEDVMTIDQAGVAVAVGAGDAVITAYTEPSFGGWALPLRRVHVVGPP